MCIRDRSVTVTNEKNEGPIQYRELDEVNVRRKIEKDKGSKFYINDKKFDKKLNYKNLKKTLEKMI